MWDKKGENLTYKFIKLLKEQVSVDPDMFVNPAMSGPQRAMVSPQDLKVARKNIDQQVKKISATPAQGKQAVKMAQSVVGDIIYADADKQQRKIKPDGFIGPITLTAFATIGIPKELIGDNPRDKKNHALALRNINQIRQVLSKKYDAALPHIGIDQQKSIAAAKNINIKAKPAKTQKPKSLANVLRPARSSYSASADLIEVPTAFGGKAVLDKTLWQIILQMRKDAIADGVMTDGDKFFYPVGASSGFRTLKSQKRKWKSRYSKDLKALKDKGIVTKGKGKKKMKKEGNKFVYYVNGKQRKIYTKIEAAAAKIARQEVAFPGRSKHSSGKTVDFWLGFPLKIKNNSKIKASKIGKWLFENGSTIYGLWNYPTEAWHWELSDNNQQLWASAFDKGQTPIQIAAAKAQSGVS